MVVGGMVEGMVDKFRLTLVTLGHAVTDAVATMATPLMLVFRGRFGLTDQAASLLISVMAIGTSLTQPAFAYLSRRIGRLWLVVLGTWAARWAVKQVKPVKEQMRSRWALQQVK